MTQLKVESHLLSRQSPGQTFTLSLCQPVRPEELTGSSSVEICSHFAWLGSVDLTSLLSPLHTINSFTSHVLTLSNAKLASPDQFTGWLTQFYMRGSDHFYHVLHIGLFRINHFRVRARFFSLPSKALNTLSTPLIINFLILGWTR